jgi:hypothetical protein
VTIAGIFNDNLLGDKDQRNIVGSLTRTGVRVSLGQFAANTPPDAIRIDIWSRPMAGAIRKLHDKEFGK